jgi:cytochrome c553
MPILTSFYSIIVLCACAQTEFWQHARTHIKMDKVLQCPRCPFVTEYKHHLEYHLRNHFGSKPFQCPKCNYACVNKSMLNSHMKSHTNVYQYRCAECSYATKYCHSLKLHLQKYCHRPAVVLNPDGSLPIDGSGSFEVAAKRGPPKGTPKSKRHTSLPPLVGVGMGSGNSPSPPAVASDVPAMIATTPTTSFAALLIKNDWASAAAAAAAAGVGDPTPMPPLVPLHTAAAEHLASNWQQKQQQQQQAPWLPTCSFCHNKFTDHQQLLRHIVQHHAAENRDILAMIGVSADSLLDTADNSSKTPPHQLCSASLQPGSDGSPVRGLRDSWPKSTPVSFHTLAGTAYWTAKQARPSNSGSEGSIMADGDHSNKEDEMPRSKSMPAMLVTEEISNEVTTTKQMGERPLDLTKRVEVTSSEFANASYWKTSSSSAAYDQDSSSYEQHIAIESSSSLLGDEANMIDPQNSSQSGCNSPAHKRSRKGKAYKLDTLMRLQPDRTNSQSSVSSETSSSSDGALGQPLPTSRRPSISPTLQAHASTVGVNQFRDEYALPTANQSADSECGNITSDTFDDYTQFHQRQTQEQRSPPNLADIPNVAARQMDLASYNPAILTNNRGPSVTDSQIVARRGSSTSVLDMPSISGMNFECQHCQIVFRDYVMYMMHKGYHGYQHPFTCNMCGFRAEDRLEFFLHIARVAHE